MVRRHLTSEPRDSTGIVWFRRDLRLRDNPAWARATREHERIVAVYVVDPRLMERAGPFRRAAVESAIEGLNAAMDGGLQVLHGDPVEQLDRVIRASGARTISWNSDATPFATARDRAAVAAFTGTERSACEVNTAWGSLIHPPGSILTAQGSVSKVFGAFWKRWRQVPLPAESVAVPTTIATPEREIPFDPFLNATADEIAADDRLSAFIEHRLAHYPTERDLPAVDGTSQLSVALKLGTLSPATAARAAVTSPDGEPFLRQLAWRDWFAHLLNDDPRLVVSPQRLDRAPQWRDDPDEFAQWKLGHTGFPLVDAGMRELAATGLMHNRVRMVAASFLVKDLLIDWRKGERYFRHLLADGDVAQNVGNWQWVAGTGPDAAPYFRVFNPTTQSRRFDPTGDYIRRWVPELAALDQRSIHDPASAGPLDLAAAGVTLGIDYPYPLVNHAMARDRAIDAYQRARNP